jgi:hypothetical protein
MLRKMEDCPNRWVNGLALSKVSSALARASVAIEAALDNIPLWLCMQTLGRREVVPEDASSAIG